MTEHETRDHEPAHAPDCAISEASARHGCSCGATDPLIEALKVEMDASYLVREHAFDPRSSRRRSRARPRDRGGGRAMIRVRCWLCLGRGFVAGARCPNVHCPHREEGGEQRG